MKLGQEKAAAQAEVLKVKEQIAATAEDLCAKALPPAAAVFLCDLSSAPEATRVAETHIGARDWDELFFIEKTKALAMWADVGEVKAELDKFTKEFLGGTAQQQNASQTETLF